MIAYTDLTQFFGAKMSDETFKTFLAKHFSDLTKYNVSKSSYITSKKAATELGFTNPDAEYDEDDQVVFKEGNPFFSHFNIFPSSSVLFIKLPFEVSFSDKLETVRKKAGNPTRSIDQDTPILGWNKMDTYDSGQLSVSFKYNPTDNSIQFIQVAKK